MNGFLLGLLQQAPWGLAIVAVVWVKLSAFSKRLDRMEKRFDDYINHRRK